MQGLPLWLVLPPVSGYMNYRRTLDCNKYGSGKICFISYLQSRRLRFDNVYDLMFEIVQKNNSLRFSFVMCIDGHTHVHCVVILQQQRGRNCRLFHTEVCQLVRRRTIWRGRGDVRWNHTTRTAPWGQVSSSLKSNLHHCLYVVHM